MSTDQSSTFLRRALMLDAAFSGAAALLLIAGAGLLEGLLGLPAALLRGAGLVLVPFVAFVAFTGIRDSISRPAARAIITANAAWAVASALLLVSGWVAPTALGTAFVIGQAVAVALQGSLTPSKKMRGSMRRPHSGGPSRRSNALIQLVEPRGIEPLTSAVRLGPAMFSGVSPGSRAFRITD